MRKTIALADVVAPIPDGTGEVRPPDPLGRIRSTAANNVPEPASMALICLALAALALTRRRKG